MRIAVWHNLPDGGARRSLVAHARGLCGRGHIVEVWSPPMGRLAHRMPFDDTVVQHETPLQPMPPLGATYLSRIRQYMHEHQQLVANMKAHTEAAAAEINAGGFDVLFATNCLLFHSPMIGRYVSGPKLLYLQDPKRMLYEAGDRLIWRSLTPLPESAPVRQKLRARFHDAVGIRDARKLAELDYLNAAAFDSMLVNSYFSRESMLRAYNIDSRVCYLGIDSDLFKLASGPKLPYVIGVGSITPNKNLEFLIRAVGSVHGRRPRLVWAGHYANDDYKATVTSLARTCGVELDVRVDVSDAELIGLLGQAMAFVYAPRLEPFGFAPLEANACGTVAIAIREGGVRESISDGVNGFLVDGEPEAFGEKIAWLMNQPELAQSMGRQAAEHVRSNWTWDRSVDILETELRKLAAK